jgi:hypothetical protein
MRYWIQADNNNNQKKNNDNNNNNKPVSRDKIAIEHHGSQLENTQIYLQFWNTFLIVMMVNQEKALKTKVIRAVYTMLKTFSLLQHRKLLTAGQSLTLTDVSETDIGASVIESFDISSLAKCGCC